MRIARWLMVLAVTPGMAWAHAQPRRSAPASDATVAAPAEVSILFSEALEPRFSSIEVTDAGGVRVDRADAHLLAEDARVLSVGLRPLAHGAYRVRWRVVSVDTHRTEGGYGFTVVP